MTTMGVLLLVVVVVAVLTPASAAPLTQRGTQKQREGGRTFYASPSGADGQSGSLSAPFRTVQRCVNAATLRGDRCLVRGGVYRETVWLNHSAPGV